MLLILVLISESVSLVPPLQEGVELLQDTLFHVDFTAERAASMVGQLLNGIPAKKLRLGGGTHFVYIT